MQRKARDVETLDLLTSIERQTRSLTVWRMARAGRHPLQATSPKGRWDDGSFEVLYTACERDGAMAEMHYHLTFGQPVFPSLLQIRLYELKLRAASAIAFEDVEQLTPFGVDPRKFGSLEYARLQEEYSPTQKLAEACQFLEIDALFVPNARWACQNAVIFMANLQPGSLQLVADHGAVDLRQWARSNGR